MVLFDGTSPAGAPRYKPHTMPILPTAQRAFEGRRYQRAADIVGLARSQKAQPLVFRIGSGSHLINGEILLL